MMSYIKVEFINTGREIIDILVAKLSELNYEGFEEDDKKLSAYIPASEFNQDELKLLTAGYDVSFNVSEIPATNWNAVWESNFKPVTVDDFCTIRADFHEPSNQTRFEIVITPKMSFGTGHHATTYMMMKQMETIDFTDKTVLDFGTGTGVLAILAAKLGALEVTAIDNDEWSVENAGENIEKNNTSIELRMADNALIEKKIDIILANIIRTVILDNFTFFNSQLNDDGVLLLSGLLEDDEAEIMQAAEKYGFKFQNRLKRESWLCLKFQK